jgi:flavodoxin
VARILVIDYSRSGNTHKVAQAIAGACGADLEQIRDAKPRHGLWGWIRSGREAIRAIPGEIRSPRRDPADYDLVVLGSPVWASHVSSPMRAYLGERSGSLTRIALFVTEGGSGGPKALAEMSALAGRQPVATLEVRAKELGGDLRSTVENFVVRVLEAAARAPALSSAS